MSLNVGLSRKSPATDNTLTLNNRPIGFDELVKALFYDVYLSKNITILKVAFVRGEGLWRYAQVFRCLLKSSVNPQIHDSI